jgi:hypothetical protein
LKNGNLNKLGLESVTVWSISTGVNISSMRMMKKCAAEQNYTGDVRGTTHAL